MRKQLVFNSSLSTKLVRWNESDDCCRWKGVGCDGGGRVVSLKLYNEGISGGLDESSSLFGLEYLEELDLSFNAFSGSIPSMLSNLTRLVRLDLSNNYFTASIPSTLSNLTRLSYLDLSGNRLESPIPISSLFNLQNLNFFFLSDNRFSDTIELEKILLSLPKLNSLDLSSNNLSLADSTTTSPAAAAVRKSSLSFLDLSNNKIRGEIPSWIWDIESLVSLNLSCNMLVDLQKPYNIPASLYILDLHSNQLRGELPSPLIQGASNADLSKLTVLDLSNNNLSGRIPDCLFENAESLHVLNLGRNKFSGHIPDKFTTYSSLRSLDLSDNNLVGDVPLSLANPSMLEVLNLSGNKLSGTIPPNLEKLAVLNLGRNNMTGPISLANFTADCPLQYLVLNNNNFTGEVPTSLANCKQLAVMNVGNNQIEGSFPCMLPSSLQVLVLRSNRFHGEVTCRKKQSWPNLQIIDIGSNHFSGYLNPLNFSTWRGMVRDTVTKLSHKTLGFKADDGWDSAYYREEVTLTMNGVQRKIVKIWPYFTSIDFSNNSFYGGIPDSISGLDGLYLLNLSHNSLTGAIPKSIGNLSSLVSLDLSTNRITGEIPSKIAGLTLLAAMNVSHNELVGQIPASTQIQTFPADCFEGNLGLCGLPLNIKCSKPHPVPPPPNVETEREIAWEYVFAAAGYAVGLGSFSWLLLFCRGFRYKYFEKIEDVFEEILGCCQRRKKRRAKGTRAARVQLTRKR